MLVATKCHTENKNVYFVYYYTTLADYFCYEFDQNLFLFMAAHVKAECDFLWRKIVYNCIGSILTCAELV